LSTQRTHVRLTLTTVLTAIAGTGTLANPASADGRILTTNKTASNLASTFELQSLTPPNVIAAKTLPAQKPNALNLRENFSAHALSALRLAQNKTSSTLPETQTLTDASPDSIPLQNTTLDGFSVLPLVTTKDPDQTVTASSQSGTVSSPPPEEDEKILFEADSISRQSEDSPVIAEGNVRAFFGERYLTADKLVFYPQTNVVIADGTVSITDERSETVFAERVELSGDLRDGIAENFTALLAENALVAADSAIREQGARTTLRKVVYTACDVCTEDGDKKTPTWRIKSLRVTRDEERRVIRFRHAFLELKGVPILYTPFIQAPDPSVERQSGFLTPTIGTSSRISPFVEIPYFFSISNQQDFTFFPKVTLDDGVLWQGEWRRAGRKSFHVWAGGVIDFDRPLRDAAFNLVNAAGQSVDAFNNVIPTDLVITSANGAAPFNQRLISAADNPEDLPVDAPGVRWYYFGRGYQNVTEKLRLGYDIERVSDDAFLRFYDVQRRGDLRLEFDRSRTNRLRSNANAAWTSGNTSFTADTYLFQGLRTTDDSSLTPFVLPLINFRHSFDYKPLGGNLALNANLAVLQRNRGLDSRRGTIQAFWDREHITKGGHRLRAFAEARGDIFFFEDINEGTELNQTTDTFFNPLIPAGSPNTDTVARFAPTAGVEWSYPVARKIGSARLLLEPRVQLVASLKNRNPDSIINEDSQSIEFDYAGLFDYNKSTGFDAVEDGQRINAGILAALNLDNGLQVEASIGQQFRIQNTNAFQFTDGLGETRSDLVGEFNIGYGRTFSFNNRFRFDDDGSFGRLETNFGFNFWRLDGNINYTLLEEEFEDLATGPFAIGLQSEEELNTSARFRLTQHWNIGAAWREDLRPDPQFGGEGTIRQDFLLGYKDECSSFDIILRRDRTRDINLPPNTSFLFRFTLRSLASSRGIRSRN